MGIRLALSNCPLPKLPHDTPQAVGHTLGMDLRAADFMRHHDDDPINHDDVDHDNHDCDDHGDDLRGSLGGVLRGFPQQGVKLFTSHTPCE